MPSSPTASDERIESLDVLRGFALLGILVMNIQSFAMPGAAYVNPAAYGDLNGVNYWVWALSYTFANEKFMATFSLLFGAGVCLFADRAQAKRGNSTGLHYRRTFWLLVFGLGHAHLIWYGDVLVPYAVSACLVYWLRNKSPRTLLIFASIALVLPAALTAFVGSGIESMPAEDVAGMRASWLPPQEELDGEVEAYRSGWLAQIELRSAVATVFESKLLLVYFLWRAAGMMLVGMALYRANILGAQRDAAFYRRMLAIGGLTGFALVATGVYTKTADEFSFPYSMFLGGLWNYWGSIGVCLAYTAGTMLVVQSGGLAGLQRRLAAAGRMAFTNYILTSVLCTLIFYGHGLGYFGHVERWQQALVVLGVWTVLLSISPWWLARFRFGPLEWAWRSLTYWESQPMRRN